MIHLCGACRIGFLEHPVTQCPFVYLAVKDPAGKVVGYEMARK